MRKMKQILPLFLMVVLFVTSVLPVYATGTTSYDYNWEGQTEVAGNGITVDLNESTENEFTLKSETENNFVLLAWNDKNNAAKLQADISEVDPTQDMVFEVSLRCATKADTGLSKDYNTPTFQVMLYGKDAKNDTVKQQLVKIGNNSITGVAGVDASNILTLQREKWDDLVFVLNPVEKSLQLYLNDSPNASYTGTYTDEFVSLTKIEVWVSGGTPTRALCIDNIKAYNVAESVEDNAASIDGVGYATLEAAVEAATNTITSNPEATVEIDLQADITASEDIEIKSGVTLDLNGCTLDMVNNYLLSEGDVVDNSKDKTGRLKIATETVIVEGVSIDKPKGKLAENNSQMPVYILGKSAYMLASMTKQASAPEIATDLSSFSRISRPSFGAAHVEKLQNGASDAGLQFILRLDWGAVTDGVYENNLEFSYSDELVDKIYTNGTVFSVTVNGLANYASNMKVSEYVISDLGVKFENNSFYMSGTTTTN